MNHISNYFLKEVISKAIGAGASWSIDDGIRNREVMEYFAGEIDVNDKVFPKSKPFVENLETAFRLCGIRYCVKLPNYPMRNVDFLLRKYNLNNRYYDYSCGWATRMVSSLKNGIDYFGTDPNHELVDRLKELATMYKEVNGIYLYPNVTLYNHGSEEYIEELENSIGVCFSSPPYFSLEDYQIGNQSYKKGMAYNDWLEGYMRKTIRNCKRYLIDGGFFVINIKNIKDYNLNECFNLEDDCVKIAMEEGFEFHCIERLENIKRCHGDVQTANGIKDVTFNDNSERIYVFRKVSK